MPNDDLGTFPMPNQQPDTAAPAEPVSSPQPLPSAPLAPVSQPSVEPSPSVPEPQFEPTPEEIPSYSQQQQSPNLAVEADKLVDANETLIENQKPVAETPQPQPIQPAPPAVITPDQPQPAVAPKKSSSAPIIIIVVLVIIAGIGLAYSAYLSQQTANLQNQLQEITQTLQKQQTALTPTPSPTVFEAPTPTVTATLEATPSTTASPSASPTVSLTTNSLKPLSNAAAALKIAIKHSPNAQLILIKVDNAETSSTAVTKYFFREDLTTKKYFYVAISAATTPQLVDKQIYVTPDDSIPSLNDSILSNALGIDLDQILKLTYAQCSKQNLCPTLPTKAQYIKTSTGTIWQVSVYNNGLTSNPLVMQLNAQTGTILYKAAGFASM